MNDIIPAGYAVQLKQKDNIIEVEVAAEEHDISMWYHMGDYALEKLCIQQIIRRAIDDFDQMMVEVAANRDEWRSYPRGEL